MKEHARKIAIVREQMKKTQNKEPTLQELAEKTGIAIEDLVVQWKQEERWILFHDR